MPEKYHQNKTDVIAKLSDASNISSFTKHIKYAI